LPGLPDEGTVVAATDISPNVSGGQETYTVQPGDSLTKIALKYDGVTVDQLKDWNDIKGSNIRVGQELIVYTEPEPAPAPEPVQLPEPPVEEPAPADEPAPEPEAPVEESEPDPAPSEPEESVELKETVKHVIGPGEFLGKIAADYGVTVEQLQEWNDLEGINITAGETLVLYPGNEPAPAEESSDSAAASGDTETYTVKSGDILDSIAKAHGTTVSELVKLNDLKNASRLSVGQNLLVPKQ
jgi:LysM repeat protein